MTPRIRPCFLFCALASGGAVHAKQGGDRIEAYESDGVAPNGAPMKNVIDAELRVCPSMHLRFRSVAGGIDFSVNGGTPQRFARPGKAGEMSITCTSAYCRFWMKQE
jgi:hypothetical protein